MKSTLLSEQDAGRSYAVVFDLDDDVLEQLQQFLTSERVDAAKLYGIGGFRRVTLGYYNLEQQRYEPIAIEEQVEILSLIGNVATYQGNPRIHAHCVVGHRDGRASGGHLLAGTVRPTLELMVDEIGAGLQRTDRPEVGIPLLSL